MPYSYSDFKPEIRNHFLQNIKTDTFIIDIGPGAGSYAHLLPEYKMDAIEIYEPYINMFNLRSIYKNIYVEDVRNSDLSKYDYVILGDVLEHLSIEDALNLLEKIKDKKYLVAVPYLFEQGEEYGNIYETHLQPDLTENIVIERYGLKTLFSNNRYGYFINYEI